MATAAQRTFILAVAAAEGTRQTSKAAALATFAAAGYAASALATYQSALAAADVAYLTAVNTARNTEGETLGTLGNYGPIQGQIGNLLIGY